MLTFLINQKSLLWMIILLLKLLLMLQQIDNVNGGLIKKRDIPEYSQNQTTSTTTTTASILLNSVDLITTTTTTAPRIIEDQQQSITTPPSIHIINTTIINNQSLLLPQKLQIITTTTTTDNNNLSLLNTSNLPYRIETTTLQNNNTTELLVTNSTNNDRITKLLISETKNSSFIVQNAEEENLNHKSQKLSDADLITTTTSTEQTFPISQPIISKQNGQNESQNTQNHTIKNAETVKNDDGVSGIIKNAIDSTILKLSDRNNENFISTTPPHVYKISLTTATTPQQQLQTTVTNRNDDIVSNEIVSSTTTATILPITATTTSSSSSTLVNDKRAKYIKENSSNLNDLISPKIDEISTFSEINKQTNENLTNKTEIIKSTDDQNVLNNSTDSSKLLTDWSIIMKNDVQNTTTTSSSHENLNLTNQTFEQQKLLPTTTSSSNNSIILSLLNSSISRTTTLSSTDSTVKSLTLNNTKTKEKIVPLPLQNNENNRQFYNNEMLEKQKNNQNVDKNKIIETNITNSSSVKNHKNNIEAEGNFTDGISSTTTLVTTISKNEGKSNQLQLQPTTRNIKETETHAASTQKTIEIMNNYNQTRIENNLNVQPKNDIINVNNNSSSSSSNSQVLNNNLTGNYLETNLEVIVSTKSTIEENSSDFTTSTSDPILSTSISDQYTTDFVTSTTTDNIMDTTTTTDQTDNFSTEYETTTTSNSEFMSTTEQQMTITTENVAATTTTDDSNQVETENTNDSYSTTTITNYFPATGPESSIETNTIDKNEESIPKSDSTTTTTTISNRRQPGTSSTITDFSIIDTKTDETQIDNNNNQVDINFSTYPTKTITDHDGYSSSDDPIQKSKSSNFKPIINIRNTDSSSSIENIITSQIPDIEGIDPNNADTDYNVIIAISVSVVGIVALILLVGFLYVMRKRQKLLTYGQRCRPVSLDAYSLDNVSVYNSVRRKAAMRASKRSYGNAAFDDPSLIHNNMGIIDLAKFVERKTAIYDEFKDIPQIIARADEVPSGCEDKNRYANVVPLPETRVILQQLNNDEKTEYINANYVRGPKDAPNYYIACQAPLEGTVIDFWRMIWEQNSRVIIMATDLIENGIEKCAEYIPASITLDNHTVYGDYQITLKNRDVKDKYAVSTLHVKNMQTNVWREITHFWYQWPEAGVPNDEAGVIAMLLEARSCLKVSAIEQIDNDDNNIKSQNGISNTINSTEELNGRRIEKNKSLPKNQQGPLTVHCSPGTGRTGTIITSDIALRSLETTKRIDIPQIVYYVRRGRASAVQTKDQYEFVYRVTHMYATKISAPIHDNC